MNRQRDTEARLLTLEARLAERAWNALGPGVDCIPYDELAGWAGRGGAPDGRQRDHLSTCLTCRTVLLAHLDLPASRSAEPSWRALGDPGAGWPELLEELRASAPADRPTRAWAAGRWRWLAAAAVLAVVSVLAFDPGAGSRPPGYEWSLSDATGRSLLERGTLGPLPEQLRIELWLAGAAHVRTWLVAPSGALHTLEPAPGQSSVRLEAGDYALGLYPLGAFDGTEEGRLDVLLVLSSEPHSDEELAPLVPDSVEPHDPDRSRALHELTARLAARTGSTVDLRSLRP